MDGKPWRASSSDGSTPRALTRKREQVTLGDVEEAVAELQNELERTLTSADYRILDEVDRFRQASSDDATLELLHSLHLVEYFNRELWCDVNPLLKPTLDRWREP